MAHYTDNDTIHHGDRHTPVHNGLCLVELFLRVTGDSQGKEGVEQFPVSQSGYVVSRQITLHLCEYVCVGEWRNVCVG